MDSHFTEVYARTQRIAKSSAKLSMMFYRYYSNTLRTTANPQATALYDLARDLQAAADALVVALERTSSPSQERDLPQIADPERRRP